MKSCFAILTVLAIVSASPVVAQNKKKGLDFTRDIQPILETLSAEERSILLDWAEAGAPIPLIAGHQVSETDFFQEKIAPLFAQHCLECHDSSAREGALDLSRKESAFKGGDSGKAILPGNAEESSLWESVFFDDMPEDRPHLSQEQKDLIKQWIDDGAEWTVDWIDPAIYEKEDSKENWIRRLTVDEYIETVWHATGVDIEKEVRDVLPPDLRADGFSNTAYNLNVDFDHVQAYAKLANLIVGQMDVLAFAERFYKDLKFTDNDMGALLDKMGRWLLRGPLNDGEIIAIRGISTTVASAGGDKEEAVRLMIEGMLQSPRFIYRLEKQRAQKTVSPVSEYELASRLSYMIWGGPPDEELFRSAEKNELKYPFELEKQVKRMLANPRAVKHSTKFIQEWLDLDRLENLRPNSEKFPNWNPELAADMRAETLAYFQEVIWSQNRPLGDLLNTQITFVSPALADFYGLQSADATTLENGLVRFDLSENPYRGGLLTQGSMLTVGGDEASMVTRGLFVLHDLLRGTVKPPPPGLDVIPIPAKPGESNRFIAMIRVNDKTCGGCHSRFEPLAFGLEKFDGLGAFHHVDEHGNELREDGELLIPGNSEAVPYKTVSELMDLLAQSDRVNETLTWKVAQWALGRPLTLEDAFVLDRIHETAKKEGGSYPSVISALVMSELVQTTRTEPIASTLN
ncbi:MAG: DUF1592 domain-containing protein [Verrucomicrobia bacterium]|nr:DUF1592 domain-containing protein [Verrucomicrobiota bacterium]MDA1067876.1 DUF1592 domain-containing protein [Verrucomicrobiota bacterium]